MAETLTTLRLAVSRRLSDEVQTVWTRAEIETYLEAGYRELAQTVHAFWDQTYLENLPAGFAVTAAWESPYATFAYGVSNYTYDDERRTLDERHRLGPANHTSPCELAFLSAIGASTAIPATADLPETVTDLARGVWDTRGIDALERRQIGDSRYEITTGEVYGYLYRQDGIRTVRKVRVPVDVCDTYTVNGSWGVLRTVTDLAVGAATPTVETARMFSWTGPDDAPFAVAHDVGQATYTYDDEADYFGGFLDAVAIGPANHTAAWEAAYLSAAGATAGWDTVWGTPRRVPAHHPIGMNAWWGGARRVFREGKNVRFEVWRQGRPLSHADGCELPDFRAKSLRDYAVAHCLARSGPGQDNTLAAFYLDRWARVLARLQRRTTRTLTHRVGILGEGGSDRREGLPPPRPSLPWAYGSRVRT